LDGPGKWEGARNAIMTLEERIYVKIFAVEPHYGTSSWGFKNFCFVMRSILNRGYSLESSSQKIS